MDEGFCFDLLTDGSLVLTVGECCIQTAARHAHREVTAALLEGGAGAEKLGGIADTLERFLGTTDFCALRAEHHELAGGARCLVRLQRREDGGVLWDVMWPR